MKNDKTQLDLNNIPMNMFPTEKWLGPAGSCSPLFYNVLKFSDSSLAGNSEFIADKINQGLKSAGLDPDNLPYDFDMSEWCENYLFESLDEELKQQSSGNLTLNHLVSGQRITDVGSLLLFDAFPVGVESFINKRVMTQNWFQDFNEANRLFIYDDYGYFAPAYSIRRYGKVYVEYIKKHMKNQIFYAAPYLQPLGAIYNMIESLSHSCHEEVQRSTRNTKLRIDEIRRFAENSPLVDIYPKPYNIHNIDLQMLSMG